MWKTESHLKNVRPNFPMIGNITADVKNIISAAHRQKLPMIASNIDDARSKYRQ